jgi:hypothetical protein
MTFEQWYLFLDKNWFSRTAEHLVSFLQRNIPLSTQSSVHFGERAVKSWRNQFDVTKSDQHGSYFRFLLFTYLSLSWNMWPFSLETLVLCFCVILQVSSAIAGFYIGTKDQTLLTTCQKFLSKLLFIPQFWRIKQNTVAIKYFLQPQTN